MKFESIKQANLSLVDDEKRIVYAPAIVPNVRDMDDDIWTEEQIEEVAHLYVQYFRNVDQKHQMDEIGTCVESFISTTLTKYGEIEYPVGTWFVGLKILDDVTWENFKSGMYGGVSVTVAPKVLPDGINILTGQKEKEAFTIPDEKPEGLGGGTTVEFLRENFPEGLVVPSISLVPVPNMRESLIYASKNSGLLERILKIFKSQKAQDLEAYIVGLEAELEKNEEVEEMDVEKIKEVILTVLTELGLVKAGDEAEEKKVEAAAEAVAEEVKAEVAEVAAETADPDEVEQMKARIAELEGQLAQKSAKSKQIDERNAAEVKTETAGITILANGRVIRNKKQ